MNYEVAKVDKKKMEKRMERYAVLAERMAKRRKNK